MLAKVLLLALPLLAAAVPTVELSGEEEAEVFKTLEKAAFDTVKPENGRCVVGAALMADKERGMQIEYAANGTQVGGSKRLTTSTVRVDVPGEEGWAKFEVNAWKAAVDSDGTVQGFGRAKGFSKGRPVPQFPDSKYQNWTISTSRVGVVQVSWQC
jgi:hypothetical protein